MSKPKISRAMLDRILQCKRNGNNCVMGRFVYKISQGRIYRAENVGYWGRIWERVEVEA